jgi:glucose-6-phosphate isomerase
MEINLKDITPDIRKLYDIKNVLHDQEWFKTADDFDVYFMYRGLEEKDGIRYDITVIPSAMLGSEFVKTKGHYHIGKYGEVYTVLEGEAIYLMEKKKGKEEIEDVYAVKAQKGDIVIIPAFYGHVTINPSQTKELKMANWVSPQCKSDYSLYEKMQGACYYYLTTGWTKNSNYKQVPELRFEEPLKSLPENLNFLKQG